MAASADAQTQPTNSRVFINTNGGYQATSTDFTDTVSFTLFVEEGDFTVGYGVETAPVFDVGGGVVLWRKPRCCRRRSPGSPSKTTRR